MAVWCRRPQIDRSVVRHCGELGLEPHPKQSVIGSESDQLHPIRPQLEIPLLWKCPKAELFELECNGVRPGELVGHPRIP